MAERLIFVLENIEELSGRITIVYDDRIEVIG